MTAIKYTMTAMRSAACSFRPRLAPFSQNLHRSRVLYSDKQDNADYLDGLAGGSAKGKTGGGEELDSSKNAPPKPKISNLSVPGTSDTAKLTEEQKREVEEHNRDFAEKHDHGHQAPDDKVDKKFWSK